MGWKEQGKKRYNKVTDTEGVSPTLRPSALMKNSQENIIVNQPKENGIKKEDNLLVSGQMTMTNTPAKSTGKGLGNRPMIKVVGNVGKGHEAQNVHDPSGIAPAMVETGTSQASTTKETSEQLTLLPYQTTNSSVQDSLARVSLLLGNEVDLKILEAHSSLRYAESYGLKELRIYSLRMSEDSSPMIKGIPFKPSSERWMNWGMTVNGRCLTAKTSESPRTGKGCSLSDILEDAPDQKYFLSENTLNGLMKGMGKPKLLGVLRGEDIQEECTLI